MKRFAWLGIAVVLAACGGESAPAPAATEGREAALAKAKAAAAALKERLGTRLAEAVAGGGPASAVAVCRDAAPRIAAEVGREQGVRLGRSSHRLRNPENRPPAWAAEIVADPARARDPQVVALAEGGRGVTLPISMQAMCATCHGGADAIPADVAAALARSYPDDRATGFAEGDLRGVFWVEIPAE